MAQKIVKEIVYEFPKLENSLTLDEGDILLFEIIFDWIKLSKRFDLSERDIIDAHKCRYYAAALIKRFPELEKRYLSDYYDDGICAYLNKRYIIDRTPKAQEKKGFPLLIAGKNGLYLFPIN